MYIWSYLQNEESGEGRGEERSGGEGRGEEGSGGEMEGGGEEGIGGLGDGGELGVEWKGGEVRAWLNLICRHAKANKIIYCAYNVCLHYLFIWVPN